MSKRRIVVKSNGKVTVAESAAMGREAAGRVVVRRAAIRRSRRRNAASAPVSRRALAVRRPEIPARTVRALAMPEPAGLLVAEGDSWFDYPFNDVLSMLEDEGFEVEGVAHRGDTVEEMAYSGGQFDDFTRLLEKLLRRGRVPDAILLSGGGNDIAGDEFAMLLNHAASGLPVLNDDVAKGVIDVRVKNAYAFLIAGLTEISMHFLDRAIPIIVHGYDYALPDGRGFLGGFSFLPGPWLRPGFHQKGHKNFGNNKAVVAQLIDLLNEMLVQLTRAPQFGHVRYVNLRRTLAPEDWANELHPTKEGFRAVAQKILRAI